MKHRSAFSLIETVVCLTLGSSIALLGVGMVHRIMQLRQTGQARVHWKQTLDRWQVRFQRDVRSSQTVETNSKYTLILTQQNGGRIRYEFEDGRLSRTHNANGTRSTEQIALKGTDALHPRVSEFDVSSSMVTWSIAVVPPGRPDPPRVEQQIVAACSRWLPAWPPTTGAAAKASSHPEPGATAALEETDDA